MILDLATTPVRQEELYQLLGQSAPCPPLPKNRFHSLILQLPPNHYAFVYMEGSLPVGFASLLIEQRITHGGMHIGHIMDLEVLISHANQPQIAADLVEHCIVVAEKHSCCSVHAHLRPEVRSTLVAAGFETKNDTMAITVRGHPPS